MEKTTDYSPRLRYTVGKTTQCMSLRPTHIHICSASARMHHVRGQQTKKSWGPEVTRTFQHTSSCSSNIQKIRRRISFPVTLHSNAEKPPRTNKQRDVTASLHLTTLSLECLYCTVGGAHIPRVAVCDTRHRAVVAHVVQRVGRDESVVGQPPYRRLHVERVSARETHELGVTRYPVIRSTLGN